MAQHFGDVVLRFNVTTVEEGRRLATAAEEMYLDVWSANQEHVDIRIAQDSVRNLLAFQRLVYGTDGRIYSSHIS